MVHGGAGPRSSVDGQFDWHVVSALLEEGQYERVAELLGRARTVSAQRSQASLIHLLAAAQRICLACNQSRAEAKWHEQAIQEAGLREREFRQQLRAIFELINPDIVPDALGEPMISPAFPEIEPHLPQPHTPWSPERPSLWQRVQSLLGRGTALSTIKLKVPEMSPSLAVYCLGQFRVYQDDRLVEKWPGNKCKCLFKYLVVHREHPVHQEVLMDLFWRDVDPEAARRNLYQAIYNLRQTLQNGGSDFSHILCEDGCYCLNPDLEIWVDSEAYRLHYQTGQQLVREGRLPEAIRAYEQAESLYQGEFLAEDRYEDWSVVYRENLKHAHLDILDQLSQYYFDRAQLAMCIAYCQKILVEDGCREDAHRRLMRCYLRQGQRHLALRQYHLCVEALRRELDVPPMLATLELYQQIHKNPAQFADAPKLREK